jgi:hypothetical protein
MIFQTLNIVNASALWDLASFFGGIKHLPLLILAPWILSYVCFITMLEMMLAASSPRSAALLR